MARDNRTRISVVLLSAVVAPIAFAAEPVAVTVDVNRTVVERFLGVGVQWDPYEYPASAEAWKTTLARVDFLRPGIFRVMLNASSYLRGYDAQGNPRYVWSDGEAGLDRLSSLFDILDYAQAHQVDVLLGEWAPSRGINAPSGERAGAGDPLWARIHADFLAYLHDVRKYTVIRYFNYMNEPNGGWMWRGGSVDYEAWAKGIRALHRELVSRGMDWVKLAGPDNSGNWEWLDRCAGELREEFGAWEMHWYAKDSDVLSGEIERLLTAKREMLRKADPGAGAKPVFLGESGMIEGKVNGDQQPRVKEFSYGVLMADYVAQVARAGWQTGIAWDMDDAMHVNTGGHVVPPGERTLKVWGFWNTQGKAMGHPEDEAMRPWFYTWSLLSRLFPKGSRIVESSGDGDGVRTLAAMLGEEDGSVMVVNEVEAARTVQIRVPGGGQRALEEYRYFEGERPLDSGGFPAAARRLGDADLEQGVTVELPGRGVVFLTTVGSR